MFNIIWRKSGLLVLLIAAMALLYPNKAMAQAVDAAGNRIEATFGGQDSAKNYREVCDVTGLCENAPDTAFANGYENIGNGTKVTSTAGNPGTGYQLSSADSGRSISDFGGQTAGAAGIGNMTGYGTRYILPTCNSAALGLGFNITTAVLETITITPYSTADSIAFSISGTGLKAGQGTKNSGYAGDNITVTCTAVGTWTVNAYQGTFSTST